MIEIGSYCVDLVVLELNDVDPTSLELTDFLLLLFPECWVKGVYHHTQLPIYFQVIFTGQSMLRKVWYKWRVNGFSQIRVRAQLSYCVILASFLSFIFYVWQAVVTLLRLICGLGQHIWKVHPYCLAHWKISVNTSWVWNLHLQRMSVEGWSHSSLAASLSFCLFCGFHK